MLPSHERLKYVVGDPGNFSGRPLPAFAPEVRSFLARLSERLLADAKAKAFADVVAFAWWCRKANIERQTAAYQDGVLRLGRGVAFHVTPTNIPVNFAFSWAFSLLAGNANLVRLPDREFPQARVILAHVAALLGEQPFRELATMNLFLEYGREQEITVPFSAIADVRIIWGGDATIRTIRTAPLPPRSVDVSFADRYSFCVLGATALADLDQPSLARLIAGFYNDTYFMDQNACSSPRLVVWLGNEGEVSQAQERFWGVLGKEVVKRYELAAVSAVDKFTQVCRDAIELDGLTNLERDGNLLYRLRLHSLSPVLEDRRGNCGYFYEYVTTTIDDLAPIVTSKYQTLTFHGVSKEMLASFVERNRLMGIDRIVPVGSAMDIGLIWDGYDLIRTLSRVIQVG